MTQVLQACFFMHKVEMKIAIVGPGIIPIPPEGWGAVEIVVWDQTLTLRELGHDVKIVNTPNADDILREIDAFQPDFVHVHYDDFVSLCPRIPYPMAITSHYGYLEQPSKWGEYGPAIAQQFATLQTPIFCLSPGIRAMYHQHMGIPSEQLFVTPNGVNLENFRCTADPAHPDASIYLAKIDYRKRQFMFQSIPSLWYAGTTCCPRFDTGCNYLGAWSKETVYANLTDYGNLVLLSDGEAHALVCLEAFAAGLGVVISQWAAANLDTTKEFITVIPEDQVHDIQFVEAELIRNRAYSVAHRAEILEYAKTFHWKHVIAQKYLPAMEHIVSTWNNQHDS